MSYGENDSQENYQHNFIKSSISKYIILFNQRGSQLMVFHLRSHLLMVYLKFKTSLVFQIYCYFFIIIPIKSMTTRDTHKFTLIYPNHFQMQFEPIQATSPSFPASIPSSSVLEHLQRHKILSTAGESYKLYCFSKYKENVQSQQYSTSKPLSSSESINLEDEQKIYLIIDSQNQRQVRRCCRNLLQQKVDDEQFEQQLQNIIKEDRYELQNAQNNIKQEWEDYEKTDPYEIKQKDQQNIESQNTIKESPSRLFRDGKKSLLTKQKSPSFTIPLKVNKNKLSLKKMKPAISQLNNYQNPEQQNHEQVESIKYVRITFIQSEKVIEEIQLKKMELVKSECFNNYEIFYDKQCTKKVKVKNITALRDTVFYCQPLQILQASSKQLINKKRFVVKNKKNDEKQVFGQQFEEELQQADKQIQTIQPPKKNIRVHQLSTMKITKKSEMQQSESDVKKIFNVRRIRNIMF